MTDSVKERTAQWSKPFHVEFRVPHDIKRPWEVTLAFDENNNLIGMKHPRDASKPTPPDDIPEGGGGCPPGTCGKMIGGRLICSSYYC